MTTELCPYCNTEVNIPAEMHYHKCPNCLEYILPCSLCDWDNINCNDCKISNGK